MLLGDAHTHAHTPGLSECERKYGDNILVPLLPPPSTLATSYDMIYFLSQQYFPMDLFSMTLIPCKLRKNMLGTCCLYSSRKLYIYTWNLTRESQHTRSRLIPYLLRTYLITHWLIPQVTLCTNTATTLNRTIPASNTFSSIWSYVAHLCTKSYR